MKKILCLMTILLALVCVVSSCNMSSLTESETTVTAPRETTPEETTPEETTPEETVLEETTPQKPIVYVQEIKCDSITVLRETSVVVGMYKESEDGESVEFRFDFIEAPEGTSYTTDPESLASNPNRVRIDYEIFPTGAIDPEVIFLLDEETFSKYVFFDEETNTFVFLRKNRRVAITIATTDGSGVKTTIKVLGR